MPAVTANGEEGNNVEQTEDKMWTALKRHIIRERQRKKEEHEAEVEEERLRKEREARERQDVMTLGETREQIQQLESKLSQLKEEKHQLFLQLKKVLNEDDNRKRQQFKESSDVGPMKIAISNIQVPMFMPPTSSSGEGQQSQGRGPAMSAHILNKPGMTGPSNLKRGRSPSPTYVGGPPPHSMSPYSQHGAHGGRGHASSMQGGPSPATQMHPSHQQSQHPQLGKHSNVYGNQGHKDGRMGREIARAVLWNKPPQYNSPPVSAPYYTHMTPTSVPPPSAGGERAAAMLYPPPHPPPPHAPPHAPHASHAPALMYAPPPSQQSAMAYHVEVKHGRDGGSMGQQMDGKKDGQPQVLIGLSDGHHSQGGGGGAGYGGNNGQQSVNRVSIHAAQIAMHNNGSKPGSITSGYPVRQQNSNVQNSNIYPNRHRY